MPHPLLIVMLTGAGERTTLTTSFPSDSHLHTSVIIVRSDFHNRNNVGTQ